MKKTKRKEDEVAILTVLTADEESGQFHQKENIVTLQLCSIITSILTGRYPSVQFIFLYHKNVINPDPIPPILCLDVALCLFLLLVYSC